MPGFDRGIIFWKRKDFIMAKNTKLSIAFYERYLLTVEEAADDCVIDISRWEVWWRITKEWNGSCIMWTEFIIIRVS